MNLFTGMTKEEIISSMLDFVFFNGLIVLIVIALAAFYVTSRPRRGRVRTAAIWHMVATLWLVLALISTVWAAPAEKAFTENGHLFTGERFSKVVIGAVFAAVALACMLIGAVRGSRQKRAMQREALTPAS